MPRRHPNAARALETPATWVMRQQNSLLCLVLGSVYCATALLRVSSLCLSKPALWNDPFTTTLRLTAAPGTDFILKPRLPLPVHYFRQCAHVKENNEESLAAICSKGVIDNNKCLCVAFPFLLFAPCQQSDVAFRGQMSFQQQLNRQISFHQR